MTIRELYNTIDNIADDSILDREINIQIISDNQDIDNYSIAWLDTMSIGPKANIIARTPAAIKIYNDPRQRAMIERYAWDDYEDEDEDEDDYEDEDYDDEDDYEDDDDEDYDDDDDDEDDDDDYCEHKKSFSNDDMKAVLMEIYRRL